MGPSTATATTAACGLRELIAGLAAAHCARRDPADPGRRPRTTGAAGALFIVAFALLEAGDELRGAPDDATLLRRRGDRRKLRILDLQPEEGWATDPDALAR